jgi:hypothetical protein
MLGLICANENHNDWTDEEGHLSDSLYNLEILMVFMAPEVGLEPTTLRLTGVG